MGVAETLERHGLRTKLVGQTHKKGKSHTTHMYITVCKIILKFILIA